MLLFIIFFVKGLSYCGDKFFFIFEMINMGISVRVIEGRFYFYRLKVIFFKVRDGVTC